MSLIDELTQIRDDSLSALDASHNYYTHTKAAWRLVLQMVRDGQKVTIRNQTTDTTTDETQLAGLAQQYVTGYLASATFQDFVSLFERFVSEFLTSWLIEYPHSLAGNQLKFRTVLDAADRSEIVGAVVEKEVLGVAYQKVADWFVYVEKIAQLGCPSAEQIEKLAEIKASRDVLVHNNGVANAIYVDKSQGQARFADGDVIDLPEHYHWESWALIKQVVTEVSNAGIRKL